ncbi:M35 family metallo-endopeptidase [Peredibacter starrii]|uniref:M35 family metallo-endopeptidase n=1 Tax=Peredibacter starrii TaxID=28202 RepID=A0AAX4HJK3_9BACT|nr:M35 family metallo-endopeptidase [Peredibacter starrii]WPU63398.1 M35 family metallo-endopeptidase [Peredibacter starrii]
MKGLTLILSFILFAPAFAEELFQYRPGDDVNHMVELLGGPIEPTVYCIDDFKRFKVSNCGNQEKDAVNLFNTAHSMLLKLEFELYDYSVRPEVKNDKKRASDLENISQKVSCIKDKMKNIQITCQDGGKVCAKNATAYVTLFNPFQKKNNLNLCPVYWLGPQDYKSAVIIHEISHLCGTRDHEYISDPGYVVGVPKNMKEVNKKFRLWKKSPKTKTVNIAAVNADSYEFWVLYGFCLPGFDCDKKY